MPFSKPSERIVTCARPTKANAANKNAVNSNFFIFFEF